ncbi:MAG: BlaI/MecI/CopY family transcriptional regulator [Brevundimonas sp.]|uniref:BlaI/MecI/CopY family transcriptional regulator n=1 Tax=Brevundimonas sp. TaxID=1871086 RepID=UPI002734751B|nr:BlaI/MecI/CopY family transcriptional regulator [Brevundimonas sp.]MBX9614328.1 BlaI/MecI/CopY family transcriptional regulator [Caulobacteraceae bacterium]MDP3405014.1 BlaI/MecI/CopY family transcriptional regulator [Brevundimonas sp.]
MRISSAESLIMEALWRDSPLSAEQVMAQVSEDQGWTPATVKSLLNRLLTKGAVAAEAQGRRYLYRPLIARNDYVHTESRGLIDRLFDGRLAPMVAHFSQRETLSPEDVAELKRLIAEIDDGR